MRRSTCLTVVLAIAGVSLSAGGAQPPTPSRTALIAAARTIITKARYATFTTLDQHGAPQSRIVDPFAPDDRLTIWIGTNRRTRKVEQIGRDGRVTLTYFEAAAQHYVTLVGSAIVVRDPAARAKYWKEEWKAFYPNGPRGDDYVLIRVEPVRAEIVAPSLGINNDPATWRPTAIELRPAGK